MSRGPLLILAGGSNVVISDEGFPGTTVLVRTTGLDLRPSHDGTVLVTVQAGQSWDDVVALAVAEGLAGVECLSGVPGSAGATPIQNVGAYGQEVADSIETVEVFDRARDVVESFGPGRCRFGYRTSLFKHNARYVVLAVTFRLARSGRSMPIRYPELAKALDLRTGADAPLSGVRSAVLALRAGKGMVLDPADPDTFSVGSFFTNPVLDAVAFAGLRQRAMAAAGTAPPAWPAAGGTMKVSAAWLIEHAGFHKGYHGDFPGVAISGKHTLALTNRGTGTAAALLGLAREIRDGVRASFGAELHPEPVLVNCAL